MKLHFKLFILFVSLSFTVSAKQITLTVLDDDNFPVSYAQLSIEKLSTGDIISIIHTDENGEALFNVSEDVTVTVSALGYTDRSETFLYKEILENDTFSFTLKPGIISLDEVVISGQIEETSTADAVQIVNTITAEQIKNQGAVNLEDVLATQQNVRLSQDLILGSGLSLMGLSGQNVKIMIDGIPVIGRQGGNIDLSQINLNNVERIEIIEGPMSVNYGSDALAGTINLITKKGNSDSLALKTTLFYETVGQYKADLNVSKTFKNSFLTINGGRNFFKGWSEVDTSRSKDWKPKEQYFASLDYIYCFPKTEIRFKTDFFNDLISNKGDERAPFYIQAFDDKYITNRISNALTIEHPVKNGKVKIISAYNYYNRKKNSYITDLTNVTSELSSDVSAHDTSSFDLLMSRGTLNLSNDSSRAKYQVGYDINREGGSGKRILNNRQHIIDLAGFANMEYKIGDYILLRPGLRVAYNSAYKAPISPSFHLKIGNKKQNLRASYARGFRAPSLKDLYFNFVDINHNIQGNTELDAEYSHNYQINYSYNKTIRNKTAFHSTIGVYFNDIANLITLAQVPNTTEYSYENVEEFKTKGIRNNNTFKSKNYSFSLGFSFLGRFNQLSTETSAEKYSYSPEVLLSATHKFSKLKTTASVFAKYQGELSGFFLDEDQNLVQSSIAPFTYADASLNRSFIKDRLNIVAGVKNILNIKSVSSITEGGSHSNSTTSTPISYGRTFFTTISLKLSK